MNYTLEQIFAQAKQDNFSAKIDESGYQSVILYGIKIVKDNVTGQIQLFNSGNNADYYNNATKEEIDVFLDKGWRVGVYTSSLVKYLGKLYLIRLAIRKEFSGDNDKKIIKSLNEKKIYILGRYMTVRKKLNFNNKK
jgi:hypothetical protein